jgi:hypothetical protein
MSQAKRHRCLFCKKRIRPNRNVRVIEQGVTTRWGYEREMEVDAAEMAHQSCFDRSMRRFKVG